MEGQMAKHFRNIAVAVKPQKGMTSKTSFPFAVFFVPARPGRNKKSKEFTAS